MTQLSELRKLRNSKFETRNPKQIRIFKCLNDQNTVDYGYFLAIKDYLDRFLKLESLLDSILELIEKIEYFFNSESWVKWFLKNPSKEKIIALALKSAYSQMVAEPGRSMNS